MAREIRVLWEREVSRGGSRRWWRLVQWPSAVDDGEWCDAVLETIGDSGKWVSAHYDIVEMEANAEPLIVLAEYLLASARGDRAFDRRCIASGIRGVCEAVSGAEYTQAEVLRAFEGIADLIDSDLPFGEFVPKMNAEKEEG